MDKSIKSRKLGINLIIILAISILCTFLFAGFDSNLINIILNISYGLLIGLSIAFGCQLVSYIIFGREGWEENPSRSFTLVVISVAIFIAIDVVAVNAIWFQLTQGVSLGVLVKSSMGQMTMISEFVLGLTIYLIILANRFSKSLNEYHVEITEMKQELSKYQYETLKSQMNPHFLFNTLNTLSGLIYEDVDKSDLFINHFAKIYRYVLEVQHEDVVPLSQELGFIENFLFLNNIRFNSAIVTDIKIEDKEQYIVPLALQIIFENAIKHNQFNIENKLKIEVKEKDGYIQISNNKRTKSEVEPSTQLGIKNLINRYSTLSDKPIKIEDKEELFTVYLPILNNQ